MRAGRRALLGTRAASHRGCLLVIRAWFAECDTSVRRTSLPYRAYKPFDDEPLSLDYALSPTTGSSRERYLSGWKLKCDTRRHGKLSPLSRQPPTNQLSNTATPATADLRLKGAVRARELHLIVDSAQMTPYITDHEHTATENRSDGMPGILLFKSPVSRPQCSRAAEPDGTKVSRYDDTRVS
jgi:hypothetical protein